MEQVATIHYEQPLNEHTRVCLRLEQLFQQIDYTLMHHTSWDSHVALAAIMDIVNIIDRPDLKAKLTQECKRHYINLQRLKTTVYAHELNANKLDAICDELSYLTEHLCRVTGKLGQALRDDPFLNQVRQHLLNPGTVCSFDIPACYYWLQEPAQQRQYDLHTWLQKLLIVQQTTALLLRLTRESQTPVLTTAHQGFYQATLDQQTQCQMIRVTLPRALAIIPEISAGRHRFSIRFYIPSIQQRSEPYKEDITFALTCCIL